MKECSGHINFKFVRILDKLPYRLYVCFKIFFAVNIDSLQNVYFLFFPSFFFSFFSYDLTITLLVVLLEFVLQPSRGS